jgi:hypothetical protein
MRLWKLLTLLLPLALFRPGPAAAQAPDAGTDLAANAALKYWEAFALVPALDADQEKLLGDWSKVPLDAAALKLLAASEKSLLYLHRGAQLRRCDWSLDYQDGMELLLPYLAKARDLGRLAALHARQEFAQGRWKAGADDAIAILALARHVGSDPIMLCILVRYGIESMAIDAVAPYLPQLGDEGSRIVAAYEALPAGATIQQAYLRFEKSAVQWLIRTLKEAEAAKKDAWRPLLKRAVGEKEGETVVGQVGTFDRAIELLEGVLPATDQLAKLATLPREEFAAQYPDFKKKTKAANLLAGHLLTAADQFMATQERNQCRMAMLKAAAAVARDGPGKLKEFNDPFGKGPFEYRGLEKGFELKSELLYQGKPVTLTVGQKKE